LTLEEIAQAAGGHLTADCNAAAVVTGPASVDSREVAAGGLFAAIRGERVDGHDYAAAAVAAGAVAALVTRDVGVPAIVLDDVVTALGLLARAVVQRLGQTAVVGVTGSSGKTSTKDMIAQILQRLGPTVATVGSFNNEIGLPLTALRADARTRYLVLEMGSRGKGHISYLTSLTPPRIGVVLNVGAAHLGEFGSRKATARAKAELAEALPADGLAVLNADDPLVAPMADQTSAHVITFGRAEHADVRATGIGLDTDGRASFTLLADGISARVRLRLIGEHHISNALAATATALGLGMGVREAAEALGQARSLSAGRMEVTKRSDDVTVVNDAFNANPDSMRAALDALMAMASGRRTIAVLGEMAELGDAAKAEHEAIGCYAARSGVDTLIAVGDHDAACVYAAARKDRQGLTTLLVPDVPAAFELLRAELAPGDVVLVKSSKAAGLMKLAQLLAEQPSATAVPALALDITDRRSLS